MESLSRSSRLLSAALPILLAMLPVIPATGGSGTIGGGGGTAGPSLSVSPSPSFVIAEWGVRHEFKPVFTPGIQVIGPGITVPPLDSVPPQYIYRFTPTDGPPDMTLSEAGVLQWIPGADRIGENVPYAFQVSVFKEGAETYSTTRSGAFNVTAALPAMQPQVDSVSYEGEYTGGGFSIPFEGYQPSDADRKYFRWSLLDPPPGASIDQNGYVKWPDDRGYARDAPYTFKVRTEYETPGGTVSNESLRSHRVLPEKAATDYSELSPALATKEGGMLGFSIAEGDGWLALGEPSPRFGFALPGPDSGRVRLWRFDVARQRYQEDIIMQPALTLGSESFGASVSISEARDGLPMRLAVGAPDSDRLGSDGGRLSFVGSVYVYSLDGSGAWHSEGRLDPPISKGYLRFGGWVSISGNTLIAGMEGEDSAGAYTGALAVFQHDGTRWAFSETLTAPNPAYRDFFSYPCATDGEWIAAAANEDDGDGENAGAVHLFQKEGGRFIHRQRMASPQPQVGGLFGERVLMEGPWLFVSAFRENNSSGAVHVFRSNGARWDFQQTLVSPYAGAGSGFGLGLAISGEVLSVSAPGDLSLLGASTPDAGIHPWKGITLFTLEDGAWKWSRQTTDSPGGYTWGFALAQPTPDLTIASMPDHHGYSGHQSVPLAGRAFLHRWPARIPDPFSAVLASLPSENGLPATATGDANGNGVPNLLEWMMGYHPLTGGQPVGLITPQGPRGPQPSLRLSGGDLHLMVRELQRGLGYKVSIESSEDLEVWRNEPDASWESFETTTIFPGATIQFPVQIHPIRLRIDGPSRYFRLRAELGGR